MPRSRANAAVMRRRSRLHLGRFASFRGLGCVQSPGEQPWHIEHQSDATIAEEGGGRNAGHLLKGAPQRFEHRLALTVQSIDDEAGEAVTITNHHDALAFVGSGWL